MTKRSFAEVLLDESTRANIYGFYDELRESGSCFWDEHVGAWIISDYDNVNALVSDRRMSSVRYPDIDSVPIALRPIAELLSRWMLYMDPPDHTRMRALVGRTFTPKAVVALRGTIIKIVDELLDAVVDMGEMDLIAQFAYPLPLRIICGMFGIPASDAEMLRAWSAQINLAVGNAKPSDADSHVASDALTHMETYLQDFLDHRDTSKDDGLLASFLQETPDGVRLSDADLMANVILFLLAGHATTTNLIGNGMLALLRNPNELAILKEHPELIGSAVEELLRYDSPVQVILRRPTEILELADNKIDAGDMVLLLNGAANRDPAVFDNPHQLNISRSGQRHISFGQGAHFCIGAALARLEAEIAIPALLDRLTDLKLAEEDPDWKPNLAFRGLTHLSVTWSKNSLSNSLSNDVSNEQLPISHRYGA